MGKTPEKAKGSRRTMAWPRDLRANLVAGVRLLGWRKIRPRDFRVSLDQAVVLICFGILVQQVTDYVRAGRGADFNIYGVPYEALTLVLIAAAAYVIARIQRRPALVLGIMVPLLSMGPWFGLVQLAWFLLYQYANGHFKGWSLQAVHFMYYALTAWYFIVVWRVLRPRVTQGARRALALVALYGVIVWPLLILVPYQGYWREHYEPEQEPDQVNAEEVFDAQRDMVEAGLHRLRPQRPGVSDIYFVGFGSYAFQDVFMREVSSIRSLLDDRFDTRGRSLNLVNNATTTATMPIASYANLRRVLRGVGRVMDPKEDVLFLYLTSHGSHDHRLSVDFWPLPLNAVTPDSLKAALDESGIQWRVIVISACYSGGFIERLKDAHTLVMTSSSASKQSFGCANGNDYTYFGQALFDDELRHTYSLVSAFSGAAGKIAAREKKEKLVPSEPQLFEGAAMVPKLAAVEARLVRVAAARAGHPDTRAAQAPLATGLSGKCPSAGC